MNIPTHIAIIMDGNRRWARKHHLPELMGHRSVADDILEPLIEHGAKRGVAYMTFWAWSTENWKRKEQEVQGVMDIFRHVIKNNWNRLAQKGVRIRTIGDLSKFPKDIQESLSRVVEETKTNKRITTVFALNYGGRDEIRRAIIRLHEISNFKFPASPAGGQISNLTCENISQSMDTSGIPDPELIIRTGGEQRLSGFLLWQSQYSELYFPDVFMPDFTSDRLDEAIAEYGRRQRRFGV